jgi:simple sugar transport system permease protein
MKTSSPWIRYGFSVLAVVLAFGFATVVLSLTTDDPLAAYTNIFLGAFASPNKVADVLVAWVPLLLATSGLLVTFTAGLWNIGIEGQITLGAIFTTAVLRFLQGSDVPPGFVIALSILAGTLGGALWASFVGGLKIYGGVNEIFGGLGMNFVATAITLWLIFGPWKRPGIGSMSGTEPFKEVYWLPQVGDLRVSWWAVGIGVVGIILIYLILNGTYFGLRLSAVGKNSKAAFLLGLPTSRYMMLSFLLCGAFAGLAGAIQVTGVYHRLIPSISSGYGFLGLLVGMLVNYQVIWAAPVAFFFAALNIGSIQLPIVLKLDSTLSGVLQGALVLFVLMMNGVRQRLLSKQ